MGLVRGGKRACGAEMLRFLWLRDLRMGWPVSSERARGCLNSACGFFVSECDAAADAARDVGGRLDVCACRCSCGECAGACAATWPGEAGPCCSCCPGC